MAQLIVRKLPAALVRALKLRAGRNGRSAEAEHRAILQQVLGEPSRGSMKDLLAAMPAVGDDADFERSDDRGRDVEL